MRVKIRGKYWELIYDSHLPKDCDGLCDSPTDESKRIRIRSTLKNIDELETLIHECLHAALWDADEPAVSDTARDVAKVLWKLGYRREE